MTEKNTVYVKMSSSQNGWFSDNAGYRGTDLSLKYKGFWFANKKYSAFDIVEHNGSLYLATVLPDVGEVPASTGSWKLFSTESGGAAAYALITLQVALEPNNSNVKEVLAISNTFQFKNIVPTIDVSVDPLGINLSYQGVNFSAPPPLSVSVTGPDPTTMYFGTILSSTRTGFSIGVMNLQGPINLTAAPIGNYVFNIVAFQ